MIYEYRDFKFNVVSKYDVLKYLKGKKVVFVDSETTIENFPRMLSFQIGDADRQYVIDVRGASIEFLFPMLRSTEVKKVGHNIKFDYKVLKNNFGVVMENIHDTMLGEQVLYTGISQKKGFYSLEATLMRYTGLNYYSDQLSLFTPYAPKRIREEISRNILNPFSDAELYYMCTDVVSAYKVYREQLKKLKEENLLAVAEEESDVALAVGDMELNGLKIDVKKWLQNASWAVGKKEEQLEVLNKVANINWNSHLQVKKIFKERGIDLNVNGKESVEEKALAKYKDDKLVSTYLAYKGFEKLNSTYGLSFLKHVAEDGRIHSNFQQIMVTGRMSSSSPNLQNIPSKKEGFPEGNWWREAFIPEKGNCFVIADYNSQEIRVVAQLAGEPKMKEALEKGVDIHYLTASLIYKKAIEFVTKLERSIGKKTNFSVLYGSGPGNLADNIGKSYFEAKKIIDAFYKAYPTLKKYFDTGYKLALERGYILIDEVIGRKSYISSERDSKTLAEIYRHNQNYKIQGNGANITKRALKYLREYDKSGLLKLVLTVHDEIVIECKIEDAEECKKVLQFCMEKASRDFNGGVTIPADAIINQVWLKD